MQHFDAQGAEVREYVNCRMVLIHSHYWDLPLLASDEIDVIRAKFPRFKHKSYNCPRRKMLDYIPSDWPEVPTICDDVDLSYCVLRDGLYHRYPIIDTRRRSQCDRPRGDLGNCPVGRVSHEAVNMSGIGQSSDDGRDAVGSARCFGKHDHTT